jgi:hypothetical protein
MGLVVDYRKSLGDLLQSIFGLQANFAVRRKRLTLLYDFRLWLGFPKTIADFDTIGNIDNQW